jgi:hypothetical protein
MKHAPFSVVRGTQHTGVHDSETCVNLKRYSCKLARYARYHSSSQWRTRHE